MTANSIEQEILEAESVIRELAARMQDAHDAAESSQLAREAFAKAADHLGQAAAQFSEARNSIHKEASQLSKCASQIGQQVKAFSSGIDSLDSEIKTVRSDLRKAIESVRIILAQDLEKQGRLIQELVSASTARGEAITSLHDEVRQLRGDTTRDMHALDRTLAEIPTRLTSRFEAAAIREKFVLCILILFFIVFGLFWAFHP